MAGKQTRHLAAIMFTDVAGYTALMQRDEETARSYRDRHRRVLEEAVPRRGGDLLEHYGDGSLSIFGSAIEAVACALEIQRDLAAEPGVPLRIGIHTGDIVREAQGVYGDGVNVASRVQGLCPPGEVLVSERVYDDVKNQPGMFVRSLGRFELKHVTRPVEIFIVADEDRPVPVIEQSPLPTGESAKAVEADSEQKSIAVLPFINMSPDPDNAFFADGLTEELIAELSGLQALRVISRTSAMQFKDTKKGVPVIARELNVRYVLEGSVRRTGDSVRITAQLIDASTDSHLWAERYAGKLDDIFDLQEQLARRIVEALRVALTPDENKRLAARPINDLRAYDAWLRARHEMLKFSKEGCERGIRLIHQAQEITGENALLHAALGYIGTFSYDLGISRDRETLLRAEQHASKALELDPNLGLALLAKGYVRWKEGDQEGCVRLLRRAIERDHSTDALTSLVQILLMVGKLDEAREAADEALALDPLYTWTAFIRGSVDFFDGQFDAASARCQKILDDLSPGDPMILWSQAQSMAHGGRLDEAREVFSRVAETDAVGIADLSELYCCATEGDRDAVAKLLDRKALMVETAKTDEWFPIFIANCLVLVGDEDGTLEWLGHAIDWGFCNYRYLEEYNPFLKPLHGNPRFQHLIDRAREKHEAFDA